MTQSEKTAIQVNLEALMDSIMEKLDRIDENLECLHNTVHGIEVEDEEPDSTSDLQQV